MNPLSLRPAACALAVVLLCAGCTTRSISNSGYEQSSRAQAAAGYRGELSELDVVGITEGTPATDAAIQAALQDSLRPTLSPRSRIFLIQSGAELPDEPMVTALARHFDVLPFSGRPGARPFDNANFARTLRLTAARGGYDKIVCYWGVLESEQKSQVTRAVSWVPVAGYFIPDAKEEMRIRLKAAIVDVATGRWTFVTPAPVASSDYSSIVSRRKTDQGLVAQLKETGYRELVSALLAGRG